MNSPAIKKIAILDTDFIIKTTQTRNTQGKPLSDEIFKLPYEFFCHNQIKQELLKQEDASTEWFLNKEAEHKIKCIDDDYLLRTIVEQYKIPLKDAISIYSDFLKTICDIFSSSLYSEKYLELESLKRKETVSYGSFVEAIINGDSAIDSDNLGEIKDALIIYILGKCFNDVFIFCSDDKRARKNIIGILGEGPSSLRCISYFGLFFVLKEKMILSKEEESDFLAGWKSYCRPSPGSANITIKTKIINKQPEYKTIDIDILFSALWNNEITMGLDGFVFYKETK